MRSPREILESVLEQDRRRIKAYPINPKKQILMDSFVFDIENKAMVDIFQGPDCFPEVFQNEIQGKEIEIKQDEKGQHVMVIDQGEKRNIVTIKNGQITQLNLFNTQIIGDHFLEYNTDLKEINMDRVTVVGNDFLHSNDKLETWNAHSLTQTGLHSLRWNRALTEVHLPNYQKAMDGLLGDNQQLKVLDAPHLTDIEGFNKENTLFKARHFVTNAPCFAKHPQFQPQEDGWFKRISPDALTQRLNGASTDKAGAGRRSAKSFQK